MSKRLLPFLIIAVFAVMTTLSWAKPKPNSGDSLSARIQLYSTTTVNNTTLTPGEYKVVAEGNQAKFEKNGKVVAEAPVTLKTLSNKAPQTEFIIDHDQLLEIHVEGKIQAMDFSTGQKASD